MSPFRKCSISFVSHFNVETFPRSKLPPTYLSPTSPFFWRLLSLCGGIVLEIALSSSRADTHMSCQSSNLICLAKLVLLLDNHYHKSRSHHTKHSLHCCVQRISNSRDEVSDILLALAARVTIPFPILRLTLLSWDISPRH